MKIWLCIISSFALLSSCTTYLNTSKENEFATLQSKRHVDVLYIETGLLDTLFFTEKYPGKLENGTVSGIRQTLLEYLYPDSVIFRKAIHPSEILYAVKDGIRYDILDENRRKYAYNPEETIQVPFHEINQMYVKIRRPYLENLFVFAIAGASAGLALMIITNMGDISGVY